MFDWGFLFGDSLRFPYSLIGHYLNRSLPCWSCYLCNEDISALRFCLMWSHHDLNTKPVKYKFIRNRKTLFNDLPSRIRLLFPLYKAFQTFKGKFRDFSPHHNVVYKYFQSGHIYNSVLG